MTEQFVLMKGRCIFNLELGDLDDSAKYAGHGFTILGNGDFQEGTTFNCIDHGLIKSAWFQVDKHVGNSVMLAIAEKHYAS